MNESLNSNMTDNSINSKETEISSSFESQTSKTIKLNDQIIYSIVLNLKDILDGNKSQSKYASKDIFYLYYIPSISLIDYIKHIMKYSQMEISTLINAIIYIDRFCYKNNYILTENNIHRILLSACLVSLKFNEDKLINNRDYSEIVGVSLEELNQLEFKMYLMLHFSLNVKSDFYETYYNFFMNNSISKNKNIKEK